MHDERAARLNQEIRVAEFRIVACPIFCFGKNDGTQDLAALYLRGLIFLLYRLRMKRALAPRLVDVLCCRSESTMVRDSDPRADRNRNNCAAGNRGHIPQIVSAALVLKSFLVNQ